MAKPRQYSYEEAHRVALDRITAARATGADWLDLGDLALPELPHELSTLVHLRALSLGIGMISLADGAIRIERYKSLERTPPAFSDLQPLKHLTNLEFLDLWACRGVVDLEPIANLKALKSLDLQCCSSLSDLTALASLTALQSLNLVGCSVVTTLSPLSALNSLGRLEIGWRTGIIDVTAIKALNGLTSLSITGNCVMDLQFLEPLTSLQSLEISACEISDFSPLEYCKALTALEIHTAYNLTDLNSLRKLERLQSLNLSFNEHITDILPLVHLKCLRLLNLSRCFELTNVAPLAKLVDLQSLDLSYNHALSDLRPLSSLTSLQVLDITNCNLVTDLTPLASLVALRCLRMGHLEGVTDLKPLESLRNLILLDLGRCRSIADLRPVGNLTSLQWLELDWKEHLVDISPLSSLKRLRYLGMAVCRKVIDVAPLAALPALKELDLSYCGNASFAPLEPLLPQLLSLRLRDSDIVDLPREVCGKNDGNSHNVIELVRSHYRDLHACASVDTERKVLILGNGTVGKTQLVRRLRGELFDPSIPSTHGIELGTVTIQLYDISEPITLNLWDFGGQDIYHGAHSLFLQDGAVYLILWHPDRELGSITQAGVRMHHRPLTYWLDLVRSVADSNAPVLIVQCQCDQPKDRRSSPPAALDRLDYVRTLACSAATDFGLKTVQAELEDAVQYSISQRALCPIGRGRVQVRQQLWAMRDEDRLLSPEYRKHRTLTVGEFQTLCEETGGVSDPIALLHFLHHSGVVYYRADLPLDRIILDQDWALQAIYTLFHREKTLPVLRRLEGRFTRSDLASLIWQDYSIDEQRLFLQMMQGCGVCFPTGEVNDVDGQPEQQFIAPDLLPEHPEAKNLALRHLPPIPASAAEIHYTFLHDGILRGLLSRLGGQAGDNGVFWKYGCWFYDGQKQSELVVDRVPPASQALGPYAGTIRLRAWGAGANELIQSVLRIVESQRLGHTPEIVCTNPGVTINHVGTGFDSAVHVIEERSSPVGSAASPGLEIDSMPLQPRRKRPEVFISYAWGDNQTEEGQRRQRIVDELETKLAEWGYQPIFDKRELRNGDLLSTFMKRIADGDRVLAIISAKYLCSEGCMTELHGAYDRVRGEKAAFLRHIIPIVLDEAKISSHDDRVVHSKYWDDSAKRMLANFGYLGEEDQHRLLLHNKWSKNVGDMLAFISDELHPHGFAQIIADDYRGVRELLARKVSD